MKDERGLYYYPNVANKRFRTYVKEDGGQIWFRLYNAADPKLWDAHGWVPHGAIEKAAAHYSGNQFDPLWPMICSCPGLLPKRKNNLT